MKAKLALPLLLLFTFVCISPALAKTYRLTSTDLAPAGMGEVNTGIDRNGNIEVEIKAQHLAKPPMLRPPAQVYVVWFQEEGKQPANQGQLRVNDDLNAELKTSTPLRNFDILVTAETDPSAQTPNNAAVVLRGKVQE